MNTAITQIKEKLSSKEWFISAEVEPKYKNSIVCYVSQMTSEILKEVPEKIEGTNILIHFKPYTPPAPITLDDLKQEKEIDLSSEISHLIKVCGKENLMTILNEIHNDDEKKAMGKEFEKVAEKLNAFYDEFGYDILFDLVSA